MALNTTYGLPAQATMSECGAVLTALRHLIESNDDVVVTCDAVEAVDLAMLQVLISARKTAERDNKRFFVTSGGNGTVDARLSEYGICFSQGA
jgi:anti-anti-sigma regulatory factor